MSLDVMTWVLRESPTTLGARLVLLVLAEHAHDDGSEAYPSVETISLKARVSRRGAQQALRRLESDGAIERDGVSRRGTTVWRVVMSHATTVGGGEPTAPRGGEPGDKGGRTSRRLGGEPTSPEPSLEPSLEPSSRGGEGARERNDEVPDDFPDELRPHARHVYRVLSDLAARHGARAVSASALAHVIVARPRHPLVEAAHDFAAWAESQPTKRKDVVSGYRNWLKGTGPLAATEVLPGAEPSGPGGNVTRLRRDEHPASRRIREMEDLRKKLGGDE